MRRPGRGGWMGSAGIYTCDGLIRAWDGHTWVDGGTRSASVMPTCRLFWAQSSWVFAFKASRLAPVCSLLFAL